MNVICRLLVAVLCVLLVEGKPRNCTTKTVSLPLYRLRPPGSLSVSSTVYAIDVLVGSQRFNLTLDNNAQSPVLFSKGCSFFHPGLPQAAEPRCSLDMHKDLARNLFDPAQSKTFNDTGRPFSGWGLHRHPYLVLDCEWYLGFLDANGTSYDAISGTRATETYSLVNWAGEHNVVENLMIPQVPFVLVNSTRFMVSYRWAGDGVFPLGYETGEVLPRILDGVGGSRK